MTWLHWAILQVGPYITWLNELFLKRFSTQWQQIHFVDAGAFDLMCRQCNIQLSPKFDGHRTKITLTTILIAAKPGFGDGDEKRA